MFTQETNQHGGGAQMTPLPGCRVGQRNVAFLAITLLLHYRERQSTLFTPILMENSEAKTLVRRLVTQAHTVFYKTGGICQGEGKGIL